jgi:hypothetical protein
MSSSNLHRVIALSALVVATACGSGMLDVGHSTGTSGGGGGGGSVGSPANYAGTMGDSLKHGTLTLTVSATLTVSGNFAFIGSAAIPMTGTVDTVAEVLHATGGGYTLTGFTTLGTLAGSYTGPNGNGFAVATSDSLTAQTHRTYCGSYTSTNSTGRMSIQVLSGGAAGGWVTQTTGTAVSSFLTGNVINNVSFTGSTNVGTIISGVMASDLSTITGTYAPPVAGSTAPNSATGSFSVSVSGC